MESYKPSDTAAHLDSSDADFELLENYLDAELSPAEARRIERRLGEEPELAAALGRLSAEYAIRGTVFQSLEPDLAASNALVSAVMRTSGAAKSVGERRNALRIGKFIGALVACVAISFSAGWIGRGVASAATDAGHSHTAAISAGGKEGSGYVYQVALTDEQGNITAMQKFDKLEEATAFAADVGRWQAQQSKNVTSVVTSSGL